LVNGWEAHLRTVVGERRRALQKAAKEARNASDRWHAGHASVAVQEDYLAKIRVLLQELEAANESDFDGLLKEALVCLQGSGALPSSDLPPPSAKEAAALDRIWKHRFGGVGQYKGRASDRDLRQAAHLRQMVLKALDDFQTSAGAATSRCEARSAYCSAVDALRAELEKAGEVDFDGLLRQAVRVLQQHGDVSKPVPKSTFRHEELLTSSAMCSPQAASGKSARRWRAKGSEPPEKLVGA
jgi:hypothetical protein